MVCARVSKDIGSVDLCLSATAGTLAFSRCLALFLTFQIAKPTSDVEREFLLSLRNRFESCRVRQPPANRQPPLSNSFGIAYPSFMTRGELTWTVEAREDVRIVAPAGRVDEASATAFAERLAQEIESAVGSEMTRLAIDLAAIDYMSSRGLRGLTLAQRQSGESGIAIILVRPNENHARDPRDQPLRQGIPDLRQHRADRHGLAQIRSGG